MQTDPQIAQLLFLIDTAYDQVSWHGPNLRGSIRGVTPEQAAWRPAPHRHNIWELVVHAAYWKYAAWRRLTGAKRGSFPLEGSNFFERPMRLRRAGLALQDPPRQWRDDLALLQQMHDQLRAAVAALRPSDLPATLKGRLTKRGLVTGIAAHDLYHAGQIQLLKRLQS